MRKSVFLMAVTGIFMGFGWRADHALKMQKMENIEAVMEDYVTEHTGHKNFFVVNLRHMPTVVEGASSASEVFLTLAQLEGPDAAVLLRDAGITSDAEVVLRGGSKEQSEAAARRLLTLLNWNSLTVKRLAPSE